MRALYAASSSSAPERDKTPRPPATAPPHTPTATPRASPGPAPGTETAHAPDAARPPSSPGRAQIPPAPPALAPFYMSGDASASLPNMNDPRPASRGRAHSQSGHPRRPPPRPFPHPAPSPAAQPYAQAPPAPALDAHSAFQPYPAQRTPYVGQYTMSPQPGLHSPSYAAQSPAYSQSPPYPQSPAYSQSPAYAQTPPYSQSPTYAFPHHPGLHAHAPPQDHHAHTPHAHTPHAHTPHAHTPQNQLLGYPNALHMMQGFPYAHASEGSSSSSHSFSPSPGPSALFSPHSPAHSPPPRSPHAQTPGLSSLSTSHSPSYAAPAPFAHSPLRFPTPGPHAPFFPPHSYAPSPGLYASQFASPYAQFSPDAEQGTWWYLPHSRPGAQFESFASPYALVDPYSTASAAPGVPAGHYPMSPHQAPALYPPPAPPPPLSPTDPPPQHSRPRPEPGPSAPGSPVQRPARRAPHAHPTAQRSEWVMWVGNVPADATHDELWRFLNSAPSPGSAASAPASTSRAPAPPLGPPPKPAPATAPSATSASSSPSSGGVQGGVLSVFLIARSNCAFVNFQSGAHLQAAIRRFNGAPLRPQDPRCPRLVCRVRGREDDLKAGVGGQRGAGIHVRWIKDQNQRRREAARAREGSLASGSEHVTTPPSSPGDPAGILARLSVSSDEENSRRRARAPVHHSSSSGSYASTNSSILVQHFPKRYFILKSLTQHDLDLSVEKGLWATQRHNEGVLNQAFRTSKDVYLIFSVNKSGEFYGCARMAGPILQGSGSERVSWASPADSPPQRRPSRQSQSASQPPAQGAPSAGSSPPTARHMWLTPLEPVAYESPQPVSPTPPLGNPIGPHTSYYEDARTPHGADFHPAGILSAPAELHHPHHRLSKLPGPTPPVQASFDAGRGRALFPPPPEEPFELDRNAPLRAVREHSAPEPSGSSGITRGPEREDANAAHRWDAPEPLPGPTPLAAVREEEEDARAPPAEGPSWGESFKIEWLRTDRLPFYRTRHLRNPWNHDREVKVSRDGTELEPAVGQALLDEWDRPNPPLPSPSTERRVGKAPSASTSATASAQGES